MIKKQFIYHVVTIFTLFLFIITLILPIGASAQVPSSEGENSWTGRDYWRDSNSYNDKINNLDKEKVLDLPVPILFGITPLDLSANFSDPRSGGRTHEGLDIMAPKDAPIVSPTDAVVLRIGTGESAGQYVYTINPGGETFVYLHLNAIANITEGQEIKKGTLIGYVGNTGNASGGATHLHFEIRDATGATDPLPRLTRIFPLADKVTYLKNIIDGITIVVDKEKFVANIVALYSKELLHAQTLNIVLPPEIVLTTPNKVAVENTSITRTLRVGSYGDDVKVLQGILGISQDGNFGPITKSAVVAFQISKNLTPDGIFGPLSRLALGNNVVIYPYGCTSSVGYSTKTGVKCNTVQ